MQMLTGMPVPVKNVAKSLVKLLQLLWNREYACGVKIFLTSLRYSSLMSLGICVTLQSALAMIVCQERIRALEAILIMLVCRRIP